MSTTLYDNTEYNHRIVYLDNPDTRFATAFLDTKYMNYAVNGECLQDKATGEIYLRRKSDGRLISFNQNYKEISQLMFELKALEANNSSFYHPTKTTSLFDAYNTVDPGALVFVENVDISSINNTTLFNAIGDYNADNGTKRVFDPASYQKTISFRISPKSNGFFINLHTRIVDIAATECLSVGTNGIDLSCSPTITYKVSIKTGMSDLDLAYTITQPLPLNNTTAVVFPFSTAPDVDTEIYDMDGSRVRTSIFDCIREMYTYPNDPAMFDDIDSVVVEIIRFDFTNLRNSFRDKVELNGDTTSLDNICRHFYSATVFGGDYEILLTHATITAYIDNMDNIIYNNNEFIVSVLDLDAVERWANSTGRIQIPGVYVSPTRPEVMNPHSLWAETVLSIDMSSGNRVYTGANTNLANLKDALGRYIVDDDIDPNVKEVVNIFDDDTDPVIEETDNTLEGGGE